jgi:ribosomal protein L7/L12
MNVRELNRVKSLVESAIKEEKIYAMKSLDTNGLDELFSLKKSIDREINKVMLDGIPNLFEVYKCSKLSAVKLVKHYTGLGLVESKKLLDERFG